MASTPTPPKPATPPPHPPEAPKPAEHRPEPGSAEDPHRVKTTQEEQLERSAEIEKIGVEKWLEQHDERKPGDKGKVVPGVRQEHDEKGNKR